MMVTLRHLASSIANEAGWTLPRVQVLWSPRLSRCAGLFVVERDARGIWRPEIRLSIALLKKRDWSWPIQVCGCNCKDPESATRRILEHEMIHYKLWRDGESDIGHTERFRRIAWEVFGHQSVTHGIGYDPGV
jgi:hypothetical protein